MRGNRGCAFWAPGFAALCAALMIAAGLSARPAEAARHSAVIKHMPIPDILKVPEGNVLLLRAFGKGTQKYACPVGAASKAVPHAILLAGRVARPTLSSRKFADDRILSQFFEGITP